MTFLQTITANLFHFNFILCIICLLLAFYAVKLMLYYAGTPPGPWGIPLFGYMYFLSNKPFIDFSKMAKKYGDLFAITIGTRHVIILNDFNVIKEAFINGGDIYAGKPRDGFEAVFGDYKSVFVTDGELWKEQRRFLLSSMRNFGLGKNEMEENLRNEAEIALQEIAKKKGSFFDISQLTSFMACNSVATLIFGQRFNSENAPFIKVLKALNDLPEFSFVNIADALPIVYIILTTLLKKFIKKFEQLKQDSYSHMNKYIDEHEKVFEENNIRDVTDCYLEKIQTMYKSEEKYNQIFTKEFMLPNFMILFAAGTDTSAFTIAWALMLLAKYPDLQKRVHDEIDDVIGRSRAPTMADRMNMPFTEATILEVHRYISLAPLTFYHRITDDTILRGYKIPKNSFVIANLWNVHNTPKIWTEPNRFNPERFIDENGKISNLRERVIPFSIGTRKCLGESLAKMEIFLFLVSFLQKFWFKLPSDDKCNLEPEKHIPVRRLLKYNICAIERE